MIKRIILIGLVCMIVSCASAPTPFELGEKTIAPYGDTKMTIRCAQEGVTDCGN